MSPASRFEYNGDQIRLTSDGFVSFDDERETYRWTMTALPNGKVEIIQTVDGQRIADPVMTPDIALHISEVLAEAANQADTFSEAKDRWSNRMIAGMSLAGRRP